MGRGPRRLDGDPHHRCGRGLLRLASHLARRAPRWPGSSGCTRTCRGTPPSCGSASGATARSTVPAASRATATRRCSSRSGRADGSLLVATDRTDWWSIYRVALDDGALTPVAGGAFDIVEPHWVFGESRFVDGVHVVPGHTTEALSTGPALPYSSIWSLHGDVDSLVFGAGSYDRAPEPVRLRDGRVEVLRPAAPLGIDDGSSPIRSSSASRPRPAPRRTHSSTGRPTPAPSASLASGHHCWSPSMAAPRARRRELRIGHRFWTSRGFAVVDVDYRGSTGYGRALPQPAPRPLVRDRRGGRRRRGDVPGRPRRRGPRPNGHPWRECRWHHDAAERDD